MTMNLNTQINMFFVRKRINMATIVALESLLKDLG